MSDNIDFGNKIKDLIKSKGLTLQEAADRLGYTRQGLSSILDKEDVSTSVLKKICETFSVHIDYFILDDKHQDKESSINNRLSDITQISQENNHLKEKIGLLEIQITLLEEILLLHKAYHK